MCVSSYYMRLKKRMESEKGNSGFNYYFLGYIHGLESAGVLEEGEADELMELLKE